MNAQHDFPTPWTDAAIDALKSDAFAVHGVIWQELRRIETEASCYRQLHEINAELLAALGDLLNPMYEQAYRDGQHWAMSARANACAAIARAKGDQ